MLCKAGPWGNVNCLGVTRGQLVNEADLSQLYARHGLRRPLDLILNSELTLNKIGNLSKSQFFSSLKWEYNYPVEAIFLSLPGFPQL